MRIIASFFVILFYTNSFAQDSKAFDKIYTKTFLETSNKDLKLAIKVADSLYNTSKTPLFKSRSLLLSATLHKQAGDVKKSVDYGLKSLNEIQGTENYAQEARLYGFLATQYRMLKLYDQSKIYLEKAIITSLQIKDPDLANNQMGLILQEKAYHEFEDKQFKKAIEYINSSQKYFDLLKEKKTYLTISNEHLLGYSYSEINELNNAIFHYEKALQLSKNEPETFLTGLIYDGLALIYIKKKDPTTAKKYIDLTEKVYEKSQFLELKNEIYTTSQKYYELINDLENLVAMQKKRDSVGEKISFKYREFISESYSSLENNIQTVQKDISKKNIFIIICITIIFGGLVFFYLFKKRQKKNYQYFKKIIADLDLKIKTRELVDSEIIAEQIIEEKRKADKKMIADSTVLISAKTEQKILSKLAEFEGSTLFTQKNMSLPTLATYCSTNIKYLSYVIKTYKDKDFTGYINELRINYIIMKLKNDRAYTKYKMAALADEAGFSSPTKFATIFKNITSFPPSVFIKYLEEENHE